VVFFIKIVVIPVKFLQFNKLQGYASVKDNKAGYKPRYSLSR
jgi:hypothetical protein